MIGFKDHPKPCSEYAVIRVSLTEIDGESTLVDAVTVWHVKDGKVAEIAGLSFPCAWDDGDFQAWYTAKTESGEDSLYGTVFSGGRDEWDATFGLVPHLGVEQTVDTVWPPETGLSDVGIYTWPSLPGGPPALGTCWEVVYDIKAYRPAASGAIDAITRPSSWYRKSKWNGSYWGGVRTRLECDEYYLLWSPTGYTDDYERNHTWARTWYFHSPWGLMGSYASARSEIGLEIAGVPVSDNGIPNIRQTTTGGWSAEKNYHRGRPWVTQGIRGAVSEKSVVHCAHVGYCPVDYTATSMGSTYYDEAWAYNYNRTIIVHAHALWRGDDGDGQTYHWRTISRNNTHETTIAGAIEEAYDLNSLEAYEIRDTDVTIEIMK